MKLAQRTDKAINLANRIAAIIASFTLAVMMLLTVGDVIGRYFFNRPIQGTWEIVSLLLVCAGTWGWGYCQNRKEHIKVDLISKLLPPRGQTILNSVSYLIGFAGFSLICWQVGLMVKRYIFITVGGVTDILELPYYPFMLLLAISAGMLALTLLIEIVRSLTEVKQQ